MTSPTTPLFLGIDIGTSGVRGIVIDQGGAIVAQASAKMPAPVEGPDRRITQDPAIWQRAFDGIVARIPGREQIRALAIDGTSGTLLLVDERGDSVSPGRMYNDAGAAAAAERIRAVAPPESGAHGATSPLARLLEMQATYPHAARALHQADWLAGSLTGDFTRSDDNNALKLGWDPVARAWPDWMDALGVRRELLPAVALPGSPIGQVDATRAAALGLDPGTVVVAGTTDGCASFLATGAAEIGDGVTALGSTLTIKLLSHEPIFAPTYGVYSHRLGDRWLVGGASNSGGAALQRFFTSERMAELTPQLRPDQPTGRHWHPLPSKGERFPIADPALTFEADPRPEDETRFFQALLEGIAEVEAQAYARLAELGGPALRSVRTVGGGAANPAWTSIRARLLGVPMPAPVHLEAAYGAALLARQGYRDA